MAIIFNSVTKYVEQVGRKITQSKRGDLDTLETIFIGPTATELQNTPYWGQRHPELSFMTCESASIQRMAAGVSSISAKYVGKIRSQTQVITTTPTISTSWHDASLSWTSYVGQIQHITTPAQGSTPAVKALGYLNVSYAIRYTAKAATYKYITNVRPDVNDDTFDGTFRIAATNYLGIKNFIQFTTGSSVTMDAAQAITNILTPQDYLTNVEIQDMDNGWYGVSEVYMKRYALNTSVIRLEN